MGGWLHGMCCVSTLVFSTTYVHLHTHMCTSPPPPMCTSTCPLETPPSSPPQEPVTPGTKAPLRVTLDNGHAHIVDMVVAAIGVQANIEWLPPDVQRGDDGGVLVDKYMQSNVPGVFAAGDCVTVAFDEQCPHWFQMRLWGQARTMGLYAAHCMAGRANHLMCGFNFELVWKWGVTCV